MLKMTQLCGFASGGGMVEFGHLIPSNVPHDDVIYPAFDVSGWLTTMSVPLTSHSSGWINYTIRLIIPSSLFSLNGSQVRLVLHSSATSSRLDIGTIYLGQQAASGDIYDMATTPTPMQLSVAGLYNFSIATNAMVMTDPVTFAFDKTKNHIVSFYTPFAGGSGDLRQVGVTGAARYQKTSVNDAATANATGYNSVGSNTLMLVTKIQVL